MAQLVLPRVLALIVCDGIEESDQEVGVYRLTDVRTRLDVPVFPAFRARLCVFVQMSGHRGQALCRVGIRQESTDEVIYQTKPRTISFEDPTLVVPVVFRLRNCVFPTSGLYYVEILDETKLIGERRLLLQPED